MAVTNVDELPFLLAAGAMAMLLVNPIYSWIASKSNLKKIILFCYSFLILNLILFLFAWKDSFQVSLDSPLFVLWSKIKEHSMGNKK